MAGSVIVVSNNGAGIRAALAAAQPGDTVRIEAGTYTGSQNCDLSIETNDITLEAPSGSAQTVIDCQSQSRCLSIFGVRATISGISFVNGVAPSTPMQAAAILRSNSEEEAHGQRISPQQNRTAALPIRRRPGENRNFLVSVITVKLFVGPSGELREVVASSPPIGRNRDKSESTAQQDRSSVRDTQSGSSSGGCVLVTAGSDVSFADVVFSGGRAVQGGGLAVDSSLVRITRSSFSKNGLSVATDETLTAGGAFFSGCSSVTIQESSFAGNILSSSGKGDLMGAGAAFIHCQNVSFIGMLRFSSNVLQTRGAGSIFGGGLFAKNISNVNAGTLALTSNRMLTTGNGAASGGGMYGFKVDRVAIAQLLASENFGSSSGSGRVRGAGLYFDTADLFAVSLKFSVLRNSIYVSGTGLSSGAGATFQARFLLFLYCVNNSTSPLKNPRM